MSAEPQPGPPRHAGALRDEDSGSGPSASAAELSAFLDRFREDRFVERLAARLGWEPAATREHIEIFLNEASFSLRLALTDLRPGQRMLEVGGGLCLLSLFLRSRGFDVVALEPFGEGFDFFSRATPLFIEHSGTDLQVLPVGVAALDPAVHGRFDFIMSFHVLEHVDDLEAAFGAMARALAPGGVMAHVCPNYRFPYEPHLEIPLVPGWPRLTRFLPFRALAERRPVWNSLNFITAGDVRRLGRRHGLSVSFKPGILHEHVVRMQEDRIFAERHARLGGPFVALVQRLGGLRMLRRLPAEWASPMEFRLRRPAGADGAATRP